jgi:hypothetical protein
VLKLPRRAVEVSGELRVRHMNERHVITRLEIDVQLLFDAVIDNGIEAVAFTNWRNVDGHAVIDLSLAPNLNEGLRCRLLNGAY